MTYDPIDVIKLYNDYYERATLRFEVLHMYRKIWNDLDERVKVALHARFSDLREAQHPDPWYAALKEYWELTQ